MIGDFALQSGISDICPVKVKMLLHVSLTSRQDVVHPIHTSCSMGDVSNTSTS